MELSCSYLIHAQTTVEFQRGVLKVGGNAEVQFVPDMTNGDLLYFFDIIRDVKSRGYLRKGDAPGQTVRLWSLDSGEIRLSTTSH